MRAQGIDTHHAVTPRGSGKQFGIHKATQGTSWIDPKYHERIQRDFDEGKIVGAYHWLETELSFPVVEQALHFADTIDGTPYDFIAVDFETYQNPITGKADDSLRWFFTTLKDINKKKLIYTNPKTWFEHKMVNWRNLWQGPQWILEMGIELWEAHWYQFPPDPIKPWEGNWMILQTGIENGNDQDLFKSDFEAMQIWAGRDVEIPPQPPQDIIELQSGQSITIRAK